MDTQRFTNILQDLINSSNSNISLLNQYLFEAQNNNTLTLLELEYNKTKVENGQLQTKLAELESKVLNLETINKKLVNDIVSNESIGDNQYETLRSSLQRTIDERNSLNEQLKQKDVIISGLQFKINELGSSLEMVKDKIEARLISTKTDIDVVFDKIS